MSSTGTPPTSETASSSAFNAALVTVVISVYPTDSVGADLDGPFTAATWLSVSTALAGLVIALTAPVMGQRADRGGRRRRSPAIWTHLTVALAAAMFLGVISGDGVERGLLGITTDGSLNVRLVCLVAALWFALLALPVAAGGARAPPGGDGQMFGLYATTGRVVSFLAPALFGLFTWAFVRPWSASPGSDWCCWCRCARRAAPRRGAPGRTRPPAG